MLKAPGRATRKEKEIKGIQIGEEVKLPLFADYMIPYIRDPQNFTEQLLEMIDSAMWQDTEWRTHLPSTTWCWETVHIQIKGNKTRIYHHS